MTAAPGFLLRVQATVDTHFVSVPEPSIQIGLQPVKGIVELSVKSRTSTSAIIAFVR
jgi:hypothetical protein